MKLVLVMLTIMLFRVSATESYAQSTRINLSMKNSTVKEVLKGIESKSEFTFYYNDKVVDTDERVTIHAENKSISDILATILPNCEFKVSNKNIIITKKTVEHHVVQQRKTVTGVVKDANGEIVIGANVSVKGTTNGTITDMDGKFTLDVPNNAILLVSYIGYISQEIPVKNATSINIQLKEDTQTLEEVVVVGYGTQKKVNLTGAVETVSADVIEDRPIKSVTDALQGTALGVTVSSASGKPGQFSSIKVRGDASLNQAGALVLVDGLPGNINRVNPQDIESISVLKDAASAAIYGSRAAEGVILITTKVGNTSKTKVEYSGNVSFNTPTRIPESTTALEHAMLSNLAFKNAGLAPNFTDGRLKRSKIIQPYLYRKAMTLSILQMWIGLI